MIHLKRSLKQTHKPQNGLICRQISWPANKNSIFQPADFNNCKIRNQTLYNPEKRIKIIPHCVLKLFAFKQSSHPNTRDIRKVCLWQANTAHPILSTVRSCCGWQFGNDVRKLRIAASHSTFDIYLWDTKGILFGIVQ